MTTKRGMITAVVLGIAAASGAAAQEKRVFELRTYFSPPSRLDDLQARFRDHTVKLFEKHGMTNIGYWVPIDNPDQKLIYLLAPIVRGRKGEYRKELAEFKRWVRFNHYRSEDDILHNFALRDVLLETCLRDNDSARDMTTDGNYLRLQPVGMLALGVIFAVTIVVEMVFGWPGVGSQVSPPSMDL